MSNDTDRPVFKRPVPQVIEYRFYYDSKTGAGVLKNTGEQIPNYPYIVLNEAMYRNIDVCSKYKVVNGTLTGKIVRQTAKLLAKTRSGQFKTTKNNMIFLAKEDYSGPIDRWDYFNEY